MHYYPPEFGLRLQNVCASGLFGLSQNPSYNPRTFMKVSDLMLVSDLPKFAALQTED